jgi:hypothetical protein
MLRASRGPPRANRASRSRWRCLREGAVALCRCGAVALWRCAAVPLWRCGAVALWRCAAPERARVQHAAPTPIASSRSRLRAAHRAAAAPPTAPPTAAAASRPRAAAVPFRQTICAGSPVEGLSPKRLSEVCAAASARAIGRRREYSRLARGLCTCAPRRRSSATKGWSAPVRRCACGRSSTWLGLGLGLGLG